MAALKVKILLHRSAGILGCLMVCLYNLLLFFAHEYIWAGVFTALTAVAIYSFVRDYSRPGVLYGAHYGVIFGVIWPCYHEYSNYKRDLRLDKYAIVYNKTRQRLGIPTIPKDWHTGFKSDRSVDWIGGKSVQGHERKYIVLDSLYKIESEGDDYNFKSINDTTRTISIFFKYAREKSSDSIFYRYSLKDTMLMISRHQADSLFDAAKITKDY